MNFDVSNLYQEGILEGGRDFDGLGLCFAGIVIVFTSLVLISLFITVLPRILEKVDAIFPPPPEVHSAAPSSSGTSASNPASDDAEKVAAIAYALKQQKGG